MLTRIQAPRDMSEHINTFIGHYVIDTTSIRMRFLLNLQKVCYHKLRKIKITLYIMYW